LGTEDEDFRATPAVVPGLRGATHVTAGEEHTCALLQDGTVRCWGNNTTGALGDGTRTSQIAPVAVLVTPPD
jgi:alpha-tubulin suppressor-like RCC1 family protein